MVFRVVLAEERCVPVLMDAQRLVGGNVDACVLRFVATIRSLAHDLRVRAEHIMKAGVRLFAQFVAIDEEERPFQLSPIGKALEYADGDASLAGASRE